MDWVTRKLDILEKCFLGYFLVLFITINYVRLQ